MKSNIRQFIERYCHQMVHGFNQDDMEKELLEAIEKDGYVIQEKSKIPSCVQNGFGTLRDIRKKPKP